MLRRFGAFLLVMLLAGCCWLIVAPSPLPGSESDGGVPDAAVEEPPTQAPTVESRATKRLLTLAFGMLAAILVGGTLLLALVVMWGNRARRLARSPLPPVSKQDELWFLKPKKTLDEPDGEPPGDAESSATDN